MNTIKVQTVINAPAEEVWNVLEDFGGVHKWAPSVTNSYSISENNSGPEAARHCDVDGFGSIEEYVTEWREGSGFTFRVSGVGPIREAFSKWTAEPSPSDKGKTIVTTAVEYSTRFGLIGSAMNLLIMRRKLQQGIVQVHAGLNHHVTTGELVGVDFREAKAA